VGIVKVRLSDQIVQEIKKIISQKNLMPGDKFYSENELTALLHVSRSSVREAVRLLEVTGQVTVQHGKGIFVSDPGHLVHEAFGTWLRENEASVSEHFEIRLIIDPKAAAYAAAKADPADIAKLDAICGQFGAMADTGTPADMIKLDEQFHLQLAKSTKNRTLYMMMKTMTQSLPEGWISSLHVPGRIGKTVNEHQAVVNAIKSGNSRLAEQLMSEHLANALEDIHSSIVNTKGGTN